MYFHFQVKFEDDPNIYLVRVGLCERIGSIEETAREKVIEQFGTDDFEIEEFSRDGFLLQVKFVEDIVRLKTQHP